MLEYIDRMGQNPESVSKLKNDIPLIQLFI